MTASPLVLTRAEILAHRRRVGALDERLPPGPGSLRQAAWAGLQDSMPRAALLSIQSRVESAGASVLDDPSLVQLWGPRFSAYVVSAEDRAVFTLGRLPVDAPGLQRANGTADRLDAFLAGRRMTYGDAGRALGMNPNALRYAAPTGRVVMRWDGARQPTIWTLPPPAMQAADARLELARRYLHVFGPGTPEAFAAWAGIKPPRGHSVFEALAGELAPVRTPIGDAWILAVDELSFRAPVEAAAPARLLPSGDTWFLLQGADRELLVPEAHLRPLLWTPRVWPGALLVAGEVAGTWRRADATIAVQPWRRLTDAEVEAVEAEAAALRLPGLEGRISVRWED